jgi:NAD(P)-dependent dehydrogenase (short-subunit alcohol dehydrogenase family)
MAERARAMPREPRRQAYSEQAHANGRMGEAENIARSVVFLRSDAAALNSYVYKKGSRS